jgi:outer membrane protein assembly factor BamB
MTGLSRRRLLQVAGAGLLGSAALGTATADETIAWQFGADDTLTGSPTVVDGTVYTGSQDNRLYALDAATGERRWQFDTGGEIEAAPTVVDGLLVACSPTALAGLGAAGYAVARLVGDRADTEDEADADGGVDTDD